MCVWEQERQHWALTVGTEHFFMVFSVWQKLADKLSLVQSTSVEGEKHKKNKTKNKDYPL